MNNEHRQTLLEGIAIASTWGFIAHIQSTAATNSFPMSGTTVAGTIETREQSAEEFSLNAWRFGVTPKYFRTMGISFHEGRDFTVNDNANSMSVAIIGETLAHRLWADNSGRVSPIGCGV